MGVGEETGGIRTRTGKSGELPAFFGGQADNVLGLTRHEISSGVGVEIL